MDLVIRGGLVVTGDSSMVVDVGITDGRIVQIGGAMQAREVIAAEGKVVVPGGVDMHVHLTPAVVQEGSFAWVDDFHSGSRAAAAGGITTVGNMTFPRPGESLVAALLGRIDNSVLAADVSSSYDHRPGAPAGGGIVRPGSKSFESS